VRDELFHVRDQLGLRTAPEYRVLTIFLWISAVLMLVAAVVLSYLVVFIVLPMPRALK
jgi:hypothetical protein